MVERELRKAQRKIQELLRLNEKLEAIAAEIDEQAAAERTALQRQLQAAEDRHAALVSRCQQLEEQVSAAIRRQQQQQHGQQLQPGAIMPPESRANMVSCRLAGAGTGSQAGWEFKPGLCLPSWPAAFAAPQGLLLSMATRAAAARRTHAAPVMGLASMYWYMSACCLLHPDLTRAIPPCIAQAVSSHHVSEATKEEVDALHTKVSSWSRLQKY